VTCKVNETVALSSAEFAKKLKDEGVVAMRGDWTNADAEITKALSEHGRNGVPLYLLYGKKKGEAPRVLPQILTSQLVLQELSKL
jgi:thiol:disulfide interchange protein DsbD